MELAPKIRIDKAAYATEHLRVHALLSDFTLEDVWRVPVTLTSNESLDLFVTHFNKATEKIINRGAAGLLFQIRLWLGKMFKLDGESQLNNELIPGSIRHCYATEEDLSVADLPAVSKGDLDFMPVYTLENEHLYEILNKTVHGALHFSRVRIGESLWEVHMAVYVKPKGLLGKAYMLLITPFRLWIVYPALMRTVKFEWEQFTREPR